MKDRRSFRVSVVTEDPRLQPVGDRPLIFHGINKSGSLVLTNVLRKAYFQSGRANQVFSNYHGTPSKLPTLVGIAEHSQGHALFVGHYLYGALDPTQYAFATVLRHPLPRVVSCYSWLKKKHLGQAAARGGWRETYRELHEKMRFWSNRSKGFPTLAEYARTSFKSHSQTSQFAPGFAPGRSERLESIDPLDQLDAAKQALEQNIRCLGISEYFEETIFLFAHLCGLEQVEAWSRDERNAKRPLVEELAPSDEAAIREAYALDFELYEFALQLFRRQLAAVALRGDIEAYRQAGLGQYKDRLLDTPKAAAARSCDPSELLASP